MHVRKRMTLLLMECSSRLRGFVFHKAVSQYFKIFSVL